MTKTQTLDLLNDRFALGNALVFDRGQGDLTCAQIQTPACSGEIYLHGGHVTRWRPAGEDEVLWMSRSAVFNDDKAIRGGVPICFPWFAGRIPADHPDPGNAPSHGPARTTLWRVAQTQEVDRGVALALTASIAGFELTYRVVFGESLSLSLEVRNPGKQPASYEQALHSYFTIGQIRQVKVTGLEGDGYLDTAGGPIRPTTQPAIRLPLRARPTVSIPLRPPARLMTLRCLGRS